jgi:hypothetical protein
MKTIKNTPCVLVQLPFYGFYNTLLGDGMSDFLEQDANYLAEFTPESEIPDVYEHDHDYKGLEQRLAELYTYHYCEAYNIENYEFESLVSPTYYNFSTDRIFAYLPYKFLLKTLKKHESEFCEWLYERMKACSGFIPHYPNKLENWPTNRQNWDHNEWGLLLEFLSSEVAPYSGVMI